MWPGLPHNMGKHNEREKGKFSMAFYDLTLDVMVSIRPCANMDAITKPYSDSCGEEIDTISGRGGDKVLEECMKLGILLVIAIFVKYNLLPHSSGDFE